LILVLITIVGFGLVVLAMSVGVLLSGKCLRGSCGGPELFGPDGQSLACATCPHRQLAERQRRESSAEVA
jgi:hypothetical protein